MSRPVEQALHNLIPRLSSRLPDELIELANGLLAQSRTKAGNLRAEEEVGRAYACANIACERLKTSLNLPPIEPRPPVAPRIYKKLYSYLDQILSAGTPRKKQKSVLNFTTDSNGVHKSLPQRHTPSKDKALESWRNAAKAGKRGVTVRKDGEKVVPNWMSYVIRLLCRHMQTTKAIPHVVAGLWSVLHLDSHNQQGAKNGKRREGKLEGKIPALIAAIWFFVTCRMQGTDLDGEEYVTRRNKVLNVLQEIGNDAELKDRIKSSTEYPFGWEMVGETELRAWMTELSEKGWIDLDWFLNIQQGELDGAVNQRDDDDDIDKLQWHGIQRDNEPRKTALGSMLIPEYDFLNDRNREAYKLWKKAILLRVDEMIRDGASNSSRDVEV